MKRGENLLRRLSGFLISFVMAIGMLTTAVFAADGSSATITVNKGSAPTLDGMTVDAYQVFKVENPEQPTGEWTYVVNDDFKLFFNIDTIKNAFNNSTVYLTYNSSTNQLSASNTAPTAPKDEYILLSENDATELDETYREADLISRLTKDSDVAGTSQSALLYTWLEKYIEAKKISPTKTAGANDEAERIEVSELKNGYYALIFRNIPDKVNVKQGILISTATGSIDLKAEEIPFTKQVADSANPSAPGITWGKNASAAVGDTLSYKLTTNVPNLTDYTNLTAFNISDTLSNQKLNANSITIKIGSDPATAVYDNNDVNIVSYTISGKTIANLSTTTYDSDKKEGTFTLEFVTSELENYEGQDIVVTYTAVLTEDAVKVNDNTAKLEYTNNGDNNKLEDKTEVYTYGIKIQKTFSDGSTTANYPRVKFKLYKNDNTGFTLNGSDGVYKLGPVATSDTEITELNLNNSDGTLTIYGLDDDVDYVLKETNTASGFNTVGDITIDLAAENGNEKLLDLSSSITIGSTSAAITLLNNDKASTDNASIAIAQFEVPNQKGFNLPQTGGAGTWMLTIGGVVLIAAAGILYFVSKNKADA